MTVTLNTFYTNGYTSLKRRSVMVHEMGHALGLGDVVFSASNCPAMPVMQNNTHDRYDICLIAAPKSDDNAGLNFLY
jgi:hypothetical protein